MDRRTFLKAAAAVSAGLAAGIPGVTFAKEINGGDLSSCLELLNQWGEKPADVIKRYSAIYSALAKSSTATFKDVSEDEEVRKLCEEQGISLIGGPMLGCVAEDGASVWVRTVRPASVEVKVGDKTFGPVKSSFETDLSAVVRVTGLSAGSTTPYKVLVDGNEVPVPKHAAMMTPSKDDTEKTRIAFATCPHRWGLGNEKQSNMVLEHKPHAILLYGDVAVQDRKSDFAMHRADYALREFHPAWQNMVAAIPVYASWDDHDYYANDAWGVQRNGSDTDRREIRKVFKHSWNNPYYGLGEEGGGIFQHTRIGPCDVIMTDNRYFREAEGRYCFLGGAQMEWLKKTLLSCKGPFIIMSCGTMWSDFVTNGKDSWGKFDPGGREEILSLIENERIPGVLLISGDRHGARVFKIPRPSGFEFYEFEPASFGGRGDGPPATNENWTTQLCGIAGKYAFGEFTFHVSKQDPEVAFRLIQDDDTVLYELTLKRSQLTPGGA
jgi:alkaline phosphatase D